MISEIVANLISSASALLVQLPTIFGDVMDVFYDPVGEVLTDLGLVIVATAGFALAWAGLRFVFGFIQRLLNKSRAGR